VYRIVGQQTLCIAQQFGAVGRAGGVAGAGRAVVASSFLLQAASSAVEVAVAARAAFVRNVLRCIALSFRGLSSSEIDPNHAPCTRQLQR